jgi:hypothetical protein
MSGQTAQDQGTLDAAREQAQEQAHKAAEQAKNVASQAGDRARGKADERSTQFGQQIGQEADDMRSAAQQLREQGKDGPAKLAEQAADRAERVGGYLRDSDADTILSDVERVARQNPWAVIAGGIALGFAASRFLKASSRQRYQAASSGSRPQLPRQATPSPAPASAGMAGATTPPPAAPRAPMPEGARVGSV